MDVKIYEDEILISADEDEIAEVGTLNEFFLKNHTSKQHRGDAYKAKVMVTKNEQYGRPFSISIRFE